MLLVACYRYLSRHQIERFPLRTPLKVGLNCESSKAFDLKETECDSSDHGSLGDKPRGLHNSSV